MFFTEISLETEVSSIQLETLDYSLKERDRQAGDKKIWKQSTAEVSWPGYIRISWGAY